MPDDLAPDDLVAQRILAIQLQRQDGVVSWAQLMAAGWSLARIRKETRRGRLRRVHPRVYVTHNGPLTWQQRAWAALLYAEPAALCWDSSATRQHAPGDLVHVAIDKGRRLTKRPGIAIHRVAGLSTQRAYRVSPPRLWHEDNTLNMAAAAADELEVIRILTDAVGRGRIGVAALRRALPRHPRMRRRAFVRALLDDIEAGVHSVLEHGYRVRVEQAHGLPRSRLQAPRRTAQGRERRDAEYEDFGVVVECDGRLNHDGWDAENRDADRDLDDAAGAKVTLRVRWKQVYGTPCRTAARVAAVLQQRGWTGRPAPCGPGCEIGRSVES